MPCLSSVLHHPLINKEDGCVLGDIRDAYFTPDCRRIVYFILFGDERERLLPFSAVAAFGDAVMTDDALALMSPYDADRTGLIRSLIGRPVFTAAGRTKGALDDVVFGSKGRVTGLTAGGETFSPSSFGSFGDALLLKSSARRKTPRVPFPEAKEDAPVRTLAAADGEATQAVYPRDAIAPPPILPEAAESFTPQRIIADYNFLIGRTLERDILSFAGERLAGKGERVTVRTVETARRHGKLIDLTLYSR